MKPEDLKVIVKEKYSGIISSNDPTSSCCGTSSCCSGTDYAVFSESYKNLDGYNPDADYNLGCGIPTEHATEIQFFTFTLITPGI